MGGLTIINKLVYTKFCGSPVTRSIGLKNPIVSLPKNFFEVYTPRGDSTKGLSQGLKNL